ncbi:MAG: L-threonylcarbamoyladenylate synthase [Eubacteriales bacterium]|nr:L-threonylcarbamoyladenylate synthase [Eubacteriales bacterium]
MKTILCNADEQALARAKDALTRGEVVGIPTETVYGLAANGLDAAAVCRIFQAKGRPADNPLILHVAELEQAIPLFTQVEETARRLMEAFWPGPFTIVLPAAAQVPREVRADLPTVAVRCPSHPWVHALIARCGFPLAAPSANLSGKPSPTTVQTVWDDMNGRIPLIVDGGPCSVGVESTVVAVKDGRVRLLRPGGVTVEQLAAVAGEITVDEGVLHPLSAGARPASPGMKYRHYAPNAHVVLYEGAAEAVRRAVCAAYDEADEAQKRPVVIACGAPQRYGERRVFDAGGSAQVYAQRIFSLLRQADAQECTEVLAEMPDETGMGLAVHNRMLRAAGFQVKNVSDQ